jgi:hypothetical protein
MSALPIQVFLVPLLGLAFVVYAFWKRKAVAASQDAQYSQYRVGELASRLGLKVVAGDPAFNLFAPLANADMMRGPSDGKPVQIEVQLAGEREGVKLELLYFFRWEQDTGFTGTTWRKWFDCRMVVHSKQAFPAFEVVSRQATPGPILAKLPLPAVTSGDGAVDRTYAISTSEPRVAQVVGRCLPGFAAIEAAGVHLVGEKGTVAFVMKQDRAPLVGSALHFAETISHELVKLARALGG